MIGQRVKYNKDMSGVIIDENETHVLILFDSGEKFCVGKAGIKDKIYKDDRICT